MSFHGSYRREDVEFLLKPIPMPLIESTLEKERLIQSGARHYSEMLSPEKLPSERYRRLFIEAHELNRDRMARDCLVLATLIHALTSLGVGMFFGVLLPTLPRWPIFWGGIVGPILWTGAIYSFMGVLNPSLARQVDWKWFIASQFAYGLVMGIVVTRSEKVHAEKAMRAGPENKERGP